MRLKLTQYPFYNIIFFIIINFLWGESLEFNTSMGLCRVEGVYTHHSEMVENIIINYSNGVNQKFSQINPKQYSVYFASDLNDFYDESGKSIPDWAFAITKKNPNRIIMQYPKNIDFLKKILIHELNHIYLNNVYYSHTIPSWFKEGMAMSESGEFSINHMVVFSTAKFNEQLFDFEDLFTFREVNKGNSKLAYSQSYIMFKALEDYYGASVYSDIVTHMNKGNKFEATLIHVTGDSLEDIDNNINEFVAKQYTWMYLFNQNSLLFIFLPLILILGYIYKRYKSKKLLRKWELEELLEDLHEEEVPN